ncbi:hypothetical protein DFP72DRAFT_895886 [Ephemerocybe angulata]|uniref:Uncharacterized protein n=1 Tax=Ephemerocybe angulata TaxID=980116 RepID=A0A8H6M7N1_9AGAR|nr:hypothetical protein DFP72DRAFT_895886 [Tulosesus angulatus]
MFLLPRLSIPKKLGQLRISASLPALTGIQARDLIDLKKRTKGALRELLGAWMRGIVGITAVDDKPNLVANVWYPSALKISGSTTYVDYTISACGSNGSEDGATVTYPIRLEVAKPTLYEAAVRSLLSWDLSLPTGCTSSPAYQSPQMGTPSQADVGMSDGSSAPSSVRSLSVSVVLEEEVWELLTTMPHLERVEIWGPALVFGLTSTLYPSGQARQGHLDTTPSYFPALRKMMVHSPGDAATSQMLIEHLANAMERRDQLFDQGTSSSSEAMFPPPLSVTFKGCEVPLPPAVVSIITEVAADITLFWEEADRSSTGR